MRLPDYKEARTRDKRDYKRVEFSFEESIKGRIERGYMLKEMADIIYSYHDMLLMAEKFNCILLSSIAGSMVV